MHLRGDALANSSFATLLLLSPPSELPRRSARRATAGPSVISSELHLAGRCRTHPRGDLLMRQALEQAGTAPAPIARTARICAVGGEHVPRIREGYITDPGPAWTLEAYTKQHDRKSER